MRVPHYPSHQQPIPQGTTKFGDQYRPFVTTRRDVSSITVDYDGYKNDITVGISGSSIKMDRDGYKDDLSISCSSSAIKVDRDSYENDVSFERSPNQLKIDRDGYKNDVAVGFSSHEIKIDFDGYQKDLTLQRRGDEVEVKNGSNTVTKFHVSFMPGGEWPTGPNFSSVAEFLQMPEQTAGALDKWFETGPDLDDLIRVDRQGNITTYEQNFR